MTSASDIMRFRLRLGASGVDGSAFLAISASNSLQKSSAIHAIQKISETLLSVIMIGYLLFFTSKILIIIDITKKIGSLIKLPIFFFAKAWLIPNSRYKVKQLSFERNTT
ncbi:hypothetical protein JN06_02696 [Bacteroides zoogleoformans]|nr:hypothetical protein JN06_02696 [Bacteroides zoogleoformans]